MRACKGQREIMKADCWCRILASKLSVFLPCWKLGTGTGLRHFDMSDKTIFISCHFFLAISRPFPSLGWCSFLNGAGGLDWRSAKYLNIFCQKFTPANNPEFGNVFKNITRLVKDLHKASCRRVTHHIVSWCGPPRHNIFWGKKGQKEDKMVLRAKMTVL